MRNALRLVLDRTTNQLVVVHPEPVEGPAPQTPLPQSGVGANVAADLNAINDRCAALRLNVLASAAQRNIPRRNAWEAADAGASALRQQLLQGQVIA